MILLTATLLALTPPQDPPSLSATLPDAQIDALRKFASRVIRSELDRPGRTPQIPRSLAESIFAAPRVDAAPLKHIGNALAILDGTLPFGHRKPIPRGKEFKHGRVFGPAIYHDRHEYPVVFYVGRKRRTWDDPWRDSPTDRGAFQVTPKQIYGRWPTDLRRARDRKIEAQLTERYVAALDEVQSLFRTDARRVFLVCDSHASGFGLRLATRFPDRFAGVVLHEAIDPGPGIQLDSLVHVPLFVTTSRALTHTHRRVFGPLRTLKDRVTLVDEKAPDLRDRLHAWLRAQKRPLFPRRIVIAPNHADTEHRNHWVTIRTPKYSPFTRTDNAPKLVVTADHRDDTIRIRTNGIAQIRLDLNDYLVDFDAPAKLIVNDLPPKTLTLERDPHHLLTTFLERRDDTAIYTARYDVRIPHRVATAANTTLDELSVSRLADPPPESAAPPRATGESTGGHADPAPPEVRPRQIPPAAPADPVRHPAETETDLDPGSAPLGRAVSPTLPPSRGTAPLPVDDSTEPSGLGFFPFRFEIPDLTAWCVLALLVVISIGWFGSRKPR